METVAKVAVGAAGGTSPDSADLGPTVKAAHRSLKRQPGIDLSQDKDLRAIAQAAQTVAMSLAPIRNAYGTGHGRARVPDVVDGMARLSVEASMMWSRWALRRLGHLLADYPTDLIDAVQTGTPRIELRKKFEAVVLAQQPAEVQHRIGIVFGQQAAGGFGNATEVGVEPAIEGGFEDYPIDYRRGLIEGMLVTTGGSIGLTKHFAPRFISLLASIEVSDALTVLEQIGSDVRDAPWLETWRGSTSVTPEVVVAELRSEADRLPAGLDEPFELFCKNLLEGDN